MSADKNGVVAVVTGAAAGMRAQRKGRILNISSAMVGGMTPGFVAYIASKMGLIGLTRALANDLGDANITVNAIAPGLTRTQCAVDMWAGTPLFDTIANTQVIKRVEEVSDLVGAMSFLSSDEASFITGQTLMVDGGQIRG